MSTQQKKENEKGVEVHPLLTREIRPIYNWHEWLACWKAADNLQTMEGLLHAGFNVSLEKGKWDEREYDETDRLAFYFSIADGHYDYFSFLPEDAGVVEAEYYVGRDSNGNVIRKTPAKLRQRLAQKAFDQLCLNFFKIETERDSHGRITRAWEGTILSERLLPAMLKFFKTDEEFGAVRIRNLPRQKDSSHNAKLIVEFVLNLVKVIHEWKEPDTNYWNNKEEADRVFAAMRARVDAAKPWTIEVLEKLGRLDILRERIVELDDVYLAKLKEIALRGKLSKFGHLIARDRSVVSIDEACYVDSRAAWFIKEYELKRKVHDQLELEKLRTEK